MEQKSRLSSSSSASSSTSGAMATDEQETLIAAPVVAIIPQHLHLDKVTLADHHPPPRPEVSMAKAAFVQIVTVCAADISSFGMGFILGYSAIALPQLQHPESWLPVTDDEASWIASLPALTLSVGQLLAGMMMDKLGRRRTLQVQCIPTLLGWILLAMSNNVPTLYAGRLLTGFGGGMVDSTIQVYISEISSPKLRGAFGSTPSLSFSLGMLIVYIMGAMHLPWNLVAALSAGVPLVALIALFFLPESPVWLQAKGRFLQAEEAMLWLKRSPQDCDDLKAKKPLPSENEVSALQALVSRGTRRPILLLVLLFFFQQFCGMNAVVFYAVHMFQSSEAGGLLDENQAAVVIAVARFLVICLACGLLTRLGRRPVALLSGLGMAAAMLTLGTVVYITTTPPLAAALACLTAFIAFNTFGFFFVPWILLGELLPERTRGFASGLIAAIAYLYIFVIVKCYPGMLAFFGQAIVFWIFGCVSLLGSAFVYFFLPETKGKTLDEIEESFKK